MPLQTNPVGLLSRFAPSRFVLAFLVASLPRASRSYSQSLQTNPVGLLSRFALSGLTLTKRINLTHISRSLCSLGLHVS